MLSGRRKVRCAGGCSVLGQGEVLQTVLGLLGSTAAAQSTPSQTRYPVLRPYGSL